jgi:putative transposase
VCCILDLFTRRIVVWPIEPHMTREMVLAALDMAYVNRRPPRGLIFHSDRGSHNH